MSGRIKRTPFHKILIANRGEIGLRIMRTARRLGDGVVAVYSDADRDALHVREADEGVHIGGALPAQSYLRIEAIIAAAKASGADAVHPGYGFLAENEEFAQACRDAGLVFIGPSPEAIKAMGNKAGAKAIMQGAGVPCVPGYQGADHSDAAMFSEASKIGFPVMIKAAAGGGGRGMRLVADAAAFPDALRSARSEAQGAFGDAALILERAIPDPRHIEIQVFGDAFGNAIHLGERDCSVQRRHQKLIEEAPSVHLTPDMRKDIGEKAVAGATSIGYTGAGTMEFLLDLDGNLYFMEMNARIQVEHPVSELVTDTDLIQEQIRVAAGEKLSRTQDDVLPLKGHAIECRINAEDPDKDFAPAAGRLDTYVPPGGPWTRVDSHCYPGWMISPFYDSLIAKLIVWAPDRDKAIDRMIRALQEFEISGRGVKTTIPFHLRILDHPQFRSGDVTTDFVEHFMSEEAAAAAAAS